MNNFPRYISIYLTHYSWKVRVISIVRIYHKLVNHFHIDRFNLFYSSLYHWSQAQYPLHNGLRENRGRAVNMCLFSDSSDLELENIKLNKQVPSKTVQCCCKITLTQLFHHDYDLQLHKSLRETNSVSKGSHIFFPSLLKHNSPSNTTQQKLLN